MRRNRGAAHHAVSTNANAIVADRPTTCAMRSGGTSVIGKSHEKNPGQSTTSHVAIRAATAPAAAAGARTRPTSLQRTPNAIATAGIARTRYPVASSEAFVPTISGGAWRIHR